MKPIALSLLILAVAFAPGIAGAQDLSVSQALEKSHIPFDDSTVFTITLQWQGPQYAYRFPRALDPEFDKLQVTRFESAVASKGTGEEQTTYKTFSYTLAPLAPGTGRIEPVTIEYVTYPDSSFGQLMTEPMTVTIDHPLAVPEERPYSTAWIWLIAALVVIGAVAAVAFIKKARRTDIGLRVKTPKDVALEQLDQLHSDAGGDLKKFQSGLYRILAGFLWARYNVKADDLDDEELAAAVRGTDLPPAERENIARWIVEARLDKFRPVAGAPGETIRRETEVRETLERLQ